MADRPMADVNAATCDAEALHELWNEVVAFGPGIFQSGLARFRDRIVSDAEKPTTLTEAEIAKAWDDFSFIPFARLPGSLAGVVNRVDVLRFAKHIAKHIARAAAVRLDDAAIKEAERRGAHAAMQEVREFWQQNFEIRVNNMGPHRSGPGGQVGAFNRLLTKYAPPAPLPSVTLRDGRVFRQVGPDAFEWVAANGYPCGPERRTFWEREDASKTRAEFAAIDTVLAAAQERGR